MTPVKGSPLLSSASRLCSAPPDAYTGTLNRVDVRPSQSISNRIYCCLYKLPWVLLLPAVMGVAAAVVTDAEAENTSLFIDDNAFAAARTQVDSQKPG